MQYMTNNTQRYNIFCISQNYFVLLSPKMSKLQQTTDFYSMKKLCMAALLLFMSWSASAQVEQIVGDWITVDDKTGQNFGIVHIYKATDGLYYGKIIQLLIPGTEDMVCKECEGADHNKPIQGLIIIRGMRAENGRLVGGQVLDPNNGKFYYGSISIKEGHLVLRGSLDKKGILGRNQTWNRAK